jgi:glycosyltransferase involved in cell wall biosynthesis
MKPLVTLVICTYNRSHSLKTYSLPAIQHLAYDNFEVIIVDNCSTDNTQQVIEEFRGTIKNLRVLRNDKNRGLCFSRNRALQHARGEIIVFQNDDVSLFPDCLDEFVNTFSDDLETMFIWGCVYHCRNKGKEDIPTAGAGHLFAMRSRVAKYFHFDTNIKYFNTMLVEEHEYARRLWKANLKVIKTESAKANHYGAPSEDTPRRSFGGELNYLYEKVKKGSVAIYYSSILLGVFAILYRSVSNYNLDHKFAHHPYRTAVLLPKRLVSILKDGKVLVAFKYLYYVLIDIPMRAKLQFVRDSIRMSGLTSGEGS